MALSKSSGVLSSPWTRMPDNIWYRVHNDGASYHIRECGRTETVQKFFVVVELASHSTERLEFEYASAHAPI